MLHILIAKDVGPKVAIINAGDGRHAHPTQAMLDMPIIRRETKPFEDLSVAIIGDIKHSRVARSDVAALQTLGCKRYPCDCAEHLITGWFFRNMVTMFVCSITWMKALPVVM